jgi:hypothetical protein
MPDDPHLTSLYDNDRRAHAAVPAVDSPAYAALRAADAARRRAAFARLGALDATPTGATARDRYHVAWLMNHGDTVAEARLAHELARRAALGGVDEGRWLSAAAFDRACMYAGEPQRFGTQIVPDGTAWRLWPVDPTTTDAERAACDVPPLAEMERRAAVQEEPQPPIGLAPSWLRAALARWSADANPGK